TYIGAPVSQAGISLTPSSSSPSLAHSAPASLPTTSNPGSFAPVYATPQLPSSTSTSWASGPVSISSGPTGAAAMSVPTALVGAGGGASAPVTSTPPITPAPAQQKRQWKRWYTALIAVVIVALIGTSLGAFFILRNQSNQQAAAAVGG